MAASEEKKKETTPSFIATIRLRTNHVEEKKLLMLSDCARQLYNACLGESLKRLNFIRNTRLFKETISLDKTVEEQKELRKKNFKHLNDSYGFSSYSIQSFGTKTKNASNFINRHLGTHVCQKIAERAFNAVQKYAFRQAKRVYFKRKGEFVSLEGKNNKTFLTYSIGYVFVGKDLTLKCLMNPKDIWLQESLKNRIKFCRIIQKEVKGKNRFYVQLILEGFPPQKYKMGKEEVGLDIGPSTIAMVGESKAELLEFCKEVVYLDKEKRRLQRKLDRQRRSNNPHYFNENGTVRKGKKRWVLSNRYIKTRVELRELERKLKETRKHLHGRDTNRVLQLTSSIKTEKLSYKAFQKLFGKSIGRKAPSLYIFLLKRKILSQGGQFREFPTYSTKLSQTCHCGKIQKKKLSERWHRCDCGVIAQRDLYSAFLAKHVTSSNKVNLKKAKEEWEQIGPILKQCMEELKNLKQCSPLISTFGI